MRPPPPLTILCAPSRAWRAACAGLGAAAAASLAGWAAGHLQAPPLSAVGATLAAAAIGALLGIRFAGPMKPAQVRWDGRQWSVDAVLGELQVMLDLERWLLLRLRPLVGGGGARWVAISCAQGSGDWRALRTALYSGRPQAGVASNAAQATDATPATPAAPPIRTSDPGR